MKIEKLRFSNFRNIESLEINPSENMNVICGENAQGKTNIIEGIWCFTGAKSFRGAKESELISFNKENAVLEADFESEKIKKSAKIVFGEKKQIYLNGKKLSNNISFVGNLNSIVFSPIDLRLVTDGPNVRRKFLDLSIGQLSPSYIEILKSYTRAVSQRNNIIKELKYDASLNIMLDIFEDEIVITAKKIIEQRKRYIKKINLYLPKIYFDISGGKENLSVDYIYTNPDDIKEKLLLSRKDDMYTGVTSIGPHRDDLCFKINDIDARSFGSQGQKRSVALSLKLAEAEVLKKNVGESPICLMDDVMSELDPERQNFILNHIKDMQVFLTCCDPSNVKNLKAGKIFNVKNGSVG